MVRMTEDRSGGGGGGSRLSTRLPSTSCAGESRNAGTLTRQSEDEQRRSRFEELLPVWGIGREVEGESLI